MNAQQAYDIIEKIAVTSSKLEKTALVKANIADPFFAKVLNYAYNPFKTYGLKALPTPGKGPILETAGDSLDDPERWAVLDALECRQLSGTAAIDAVQKAFDEMDPASSHLMWRIIRKDLRAGFSESTINKAKSGFIPDFPYMRCSLPDSSNMEKWDWSAGILSQEKADGMFCNVNFTDQLELTLTTRQGSPIPLDHLSALTADLRHTIDPGFQTHGELIVFDGELCLPREQGNGMLNSVLSGGSLAPGFTVHFYAWDQIPMAQVVPKGKYPVAYIKRFTKLAQQVKANSLGLVHVIDTVVCKTRAQAYDHYRTVVRQGKEGTVCKSPDAHWRDGTSKDQVKLKMEVDVDLKVVGFVPGEGKNAATFGSLLCETNDVLLQVAVSGMPDDVRRELHALGAENIGVITVRANAIMKPSANNKLHSLFLPRFVERRLDKREADSLAQVVAQFDAKVAA